ncbi:MAG: hypothetical protein WB760_04735 [Xanthobacteraceae bacterium]
MTPAEIEQAVFDLEEVRIVIRAPVREKLDDFDYDRKAAGTTSITDWLDQRIKPLLGPHQVVVVDGTGALPHGRTKMDKLRDSYVR